MPFRSITRFWPSVRVYVDDFPEAAAIVYEPVAVAEVGDGVVTSEVDVRERVKRIRIELYRHGLVSRVGVGSWF